MAWFLLARTLFVVAVTYAAVLSLPFSPSPAVNLAVGAALGVAMVWVETRLRNAKVTDLLGALIGGAIGLGLAKTIGAALFWADPSDSRVMFLHSFILLVFPYLGILMGGRNAEWMEPARLFGLFRDAGPLKRYRILDTSVIIDGRIADLCETGFLDGTLMIPQFVLKELQSVADSSDSAKRNRGRRGLDILQKVQKMAGVDVVISDVDFPDVHEVDLKLIELARTVQGKIVTNDFNLNKVAQLRGVQVLNINELANALKPVVLPGELMKVFILKEGKEYNQGVAYLDDGTMVVVDNARRMISRTIDVVVTSVLQTTAGKMIFGRYIDSDMPSAPAAAAARGPRSVVERRNDSARRSAQAVLKRLPPYHWWRTVFFLIPAIGLYTIALGTVSLASTLLDRSGDFGHRCARAWAGLILWTTGVRVEVRGIEHLDRRVSYVFAANHQSIYDIPILFWSLPLQLRILAKASLGRFPFLGWHLQRAGHLLVDRKSPGVGTLARLALLMQQGRSLMVFPEGTRSVDGRLGRFKAGTFLLAIDAKVPVVPVSIARSRFVMRKGRLMTCPGDVTLTIHAPIVTRDFSRDQVREFAERVRSIVRHEVDEPAPERASPSGA